MQIRILTKFQIKNQRGKHQKCEICLKQFSIFAREHQCKRCIRAICDNCKAKKKMVYLSQMGREEKGLCSVCSKESDYIENHIKQNKLVFGQLSEIGMKWNKKVVKRVYRQTYQFQQTGDNQFSFTKKIFSEMWGSYNYSFRQFIGLLTYQINQDEVFDKIKIVYDKVIVSYPHQNMQNLIYIIIFTLCYCNTQQSANIVQYLLDLKKIIVKQKQKQLINVFLTTLGVKQQQLKSLSIFINSKLKKYIGNLSINIITTEGIIYLMNKVFEQKKIDQLYTFLAILIEINKDQIINKKSKVPADILFIRNCSLQRIINKFKILKSININNFLSIQYPHKSQGYNRTSQDFDTKSNKSFRTEVYQSFNLQYSYPQMKKQSNSSNNYIENIKNEENGGIFYNEKVLNPKQAFMKKQQNQQSYDQIKKKSSKSELNMFQPLVQNKQCQRCFQNLKKKQLLLNQNQQLYKKIQQYLKKQQKQKKQMQQLQKKAEIAQQLKKQLQLSKKNIQEKNIQIKSLQAKIILSFQSKEQKNQILTQNNSQQSSKFQLERTKLQLQKIRDQLEKNKQQLEKQKKNNINKLEINQKQFKKLKDQYQSYKAQNKTTQQILNKLKQEIVSLKNQIQQLNLTNRMLKNKLQYQVIYNKQGITVQNSQLLKSYETVKLNLMQKNIELQNLMKQNKILTYQLQHFDSVTQQKNYMIQEIKSLKNLNKQYMSKISQLTSYILKEEQQKLRLSQSLFQYKQVEKQLFQQNGQKSQCLIF